MSAAYAYRDQLKWAEVAKIATSLGLTDRNVIDVLDQLVAHGLVGLPLHAVRADSPGVIGYQTATHIPIATDPEAKVTKAKRRGALTTFAEWREQLKARGEKAIPAGDPIFQYADQVRFEPDMLAVQFDHFKQVYLERGAAKKYVDWRAAFRNSVRGNWFNLWVFDRVGAAPKWTSKGLQAFASYCASQRQDGLK